MAAIQELGMHVDTQTRRTAGQVIRDFFGIKPRETVFVPFHNKNASKLVSPREAQTMANATKIGETTNVLAIPQRGVFVRRKAA